MKHSKYILALLIAPGVIAALFCMPSLLFGTNLRSAYSIFLLTSVVTYGHAIILGIPIIILFNKFSLFSRSHVLGASFLIGALPVSVLTFYREITMPSGAGYTSNGIVHRIDGNLTAAGWQSAIEGILFCGVLGAATGLVFWAIVRKSANKRLKIDAQKARAS